MTYTLKTFRTYGLAIEFAKTCKQTKLRPSLRDQLTRASESIVLNLAEGSAKPTPRDRARYYAMALGSFRECQAIFELAEMPELVAKFDNLGACLYKLSRRQ